jgi:hypothetical protein
VRHGVRFRGLTSPHLARLVFFAKQPAPAHALRVVVLTVPRVGRSYEPFPDGFDSSPPTPHLEEFCEMCWSFRTRSYARKIFDRDSVGPLGFECSQDRRTPRPAVDEIEGRVKGRTHSVETVSHSLAHSLSLSHTHSPTLSHSRTASGERTHLLRDDIERGVNFWGAGVQVKEAPPSRITGPMEPPPLSTLSRHSLDTLSALSRAHGAASARRQLRWAVVKHQAGCVTTAHWAPFLRWARARECVRKRD